MYKLYRLVFPKFDDVARDAWNRIIKNFKVKRTQMHCCESGFVNIYIKCSIQLINKRI